jgi:hypothetical protein
VGSNFSVAADTVIISNNPSDLEAYNQGLSSVKDKTKDTPLREDVFTAAGSELADTTTAEGRKAALAIDEYLKNKK